MKALAMIAAISFCCPGMVMLYADAPGLHTGAYILDGIVPLKVYGQAVPTVIDWNNDGKKDLVVGENLGYVWLYINQGTQTDPVFDGGTLIESGGVPIKVGPAAG